MGKEPNKIKKWVITLAVVSVVISAYPQVILLFVFFKKSIPQNQLLITFFKFFLPVFRDIFIIQFTSILCAAFAIILSLILISRDKGVTKTFAYIIFTISFLLLVLNIMQLL
ncbi:hypothetical protein BH09BAC2_BH09BAC2_07620 [soil metagenome]